MTVVSDTSPLSNLAVINRLDALREQAGAITIPSAVRLELSRLPHAAARARIEHALNEAWLRVRPLSTAVPVDLDLALDLGEAEAIAPARELKASLVLLDESAARRKARELGLAHTGVLGILPRARTIGRIPSLGSEIRQLRSEAGFFVGADLEQSLLLSVGEI
jgi:predicted nucleic acid-binding protein